MRKKKRVLRPMELWNHGAVEQWLEDEAAKGWRMTEGTVGWFVKLERTEPRPCRVRVYPQSEESREAFQERVAAYEEMGWQYAGVMGRFDIEIFYCDDPEAPELFTDPMSSSWAWEPQLKWVQVEIWALLILPLILPVIHWIMSGSLLKAVLHGNTFLLICILVLYPLLVLLSARQLWMIRRLRKQFAAGVEPEQSRDWRRSRRWWRLAVILYVAYWLLFGLRSVEQLIVEPDISAVPHIAAEAVGSGSDEDWDLVFEEYVRWANWLNPTRIETVYETEEGDRVKNTSDLLRFEFLAEALYQEKERDFLSIHPKAEQAIVENPAFDEAVLLTGGREDAQMLLVRNGKTVYSLWVNFPADLTEQVDAVAALISLVREEARP